MSQLAGLTVFNNFNYFQIGILNLMWDWQTKTCILLVLVCEEQWIFFSMGRPDPFSLLQLVCGQLSSIICYDSETWAGFCHRSHFLSSQSVGTHGSRATKGMGAQFLGPPIRMSCFPLGWSLVFPFDVLDSE